MATKLTRRGALVAGAAVGAAGLFARPAGATPAGGGGTAFVHGTVIDPDRGRVYQDMTVLVRGDRIEAVEPTGAVPAGVRVVDLRGRFVIPGLADMHTHGQAEWLDPALNVVNGVTTVREMSGTPAVWDWRARIEAGTLLGPRYTISSPIIDGAPSIWDPALLKVLSVADAREARQAVRDVVAGGADFVKTYSRLNRSAFRAIAAEAHRLGVPFAGHCPDEVPSEEAADLGQASIEHVFSAAYDASSREEEIRAEIGRIRLDLGDYAGWFAAIHPVEWTAANSYSPSNARRLFGKYARRRTRQVPTLAMHRGLDFARTLDLPADPRAKYLGPELLGGQQYALTELYLKDRPPAQDAEWAAMFDHRLAIVGEMHRAGVPIMTGTDTGTCGVYPGFSVHDELALLVAAGLSPMAALAASTVEPARFLGANTGRIAPGAAADLVVLGADPLADIRNSQRIEGVVVRGRYLDAAERERVLREVEGAAGSAGPVASAGCPCTGAPR
jgi:imidazolonepropionase-like amidohydrolase